MDYVYEKIAGKGPARRYNLEKCRKELERSCNNYQNRGNCFPPTPRTTPSSAPNSQPQHSPQHKNVRFQTPQSLNETAHIPQRIKRCPFQYNEDELRHRAERIRADLRPKLEPRAHQPHVLSSDPLDVHTGQDFSNDDSNNNRNNNSFAPRRHPTLHRQNLTYDDIIAIRDTAVRIANDCAVRDEQPYPESPRQETLRSTRSTTGLEKTETQDADPTGSDEGQDDNGISITEDGCIIQHGFDISSITFSPTDTAHPRCDSACDVKHTTPKQEPRKEPFRASVRNTKGARVPVCFRKQEILHQRNVSHLTALFSGPSSSQSQGTVQEKLRKPDEQQQHKRMPVPARPSVFFSGSSSSGAVVSDSEDEGEGQMSRETTKIDSATSSTVCADGTKDMASLGSVATLVNLNKLAETPRVLFKSGRIDFLMLVHTSHSGNQSILTLLLILEGKILADLHLFRAANRNHNFFALIRRPKFFWTTGNIVALGLRLPPQPYHENHNYVSTLLDKIEKNGGGRPANFSWDHVAPMHGFSSCHAFYVLD
ncbi:hypothetical protein KCU81_g8232, partial [Aureobasidium melanogenum]